MHIKETCMRAAFALLVVGCTSSSPDHKLPSATFTPHLSAHDTAVVCGDDVTIGSDTSPDLRYAFTYDPNGLLTHAEGVFSAGGANNTVDYSYDGSGNFTHMLSQHDWGDATQEIGASYDGSNNLIDYTWQYSSTDYNDQWDYAYSGFVGADPARLVLTELGQPVDGYTFGYDGSGRLVSGTADSGGTMAWAYDDQAGTISYSDSSGTTDVYSYDDQGRPLSDAWATTGQNAASGGSAWAWNGDQLASYSYSYNNQLEETDAYRYNCPIARAADGRVVHVVRPTRPTAR
jgi:YD repeat-containing protein